MDNGQWFEIKQFLMKMGVYACYIGIAVMAKIAADSRTVKLTKRAIIIKVVLSVFIGVLAATICETTAYKEYSKIIVPVATLLGESLVVWLMTNGRSIIIRIFESIFKNGSNGSGNGK